MSASLTLGVDYRIDIYHSSPAHHLDSTISTPKACIRCQWEDKSSNGLVENALLRDVVSSSVSTLSVPHLELFPSVRIVSTAQSGR
mmetsp:Transcript_17596/g.36281  ORF Transcript_17596/g.36281 Transcript_17596/m.36281 type:complete len:86 (+) Transcript_17596:86-343(+)